MAHLYLTDQNSYFCETNHNKTTIIFQLFDRKYGNQATVNLTPEEALEISEELQRLVSLISESNRFVDINKLK